jgi:hypothetical protein
VSSPPDIAGVLTPHSKLLIINESQPTHYILISGHGYVLAPSGFPLVRNERPAITPEGRLPLRTTPTGDRAGPAPCGRC